MEQINIHAAKTNLSKLVDKAAAGQSFIIAKSGKPMVKVIPFKEPKNNPRLGFLKGKTNIPDDFDNLFSKEIEEMFYGKKCE